MIFPHTLMNRIPHRTKRGFFMIGIQFIILTGISLILTAMDADRRIAALFYDTTDGWIYARHSLWVWFHRYGTIPGLVFITCSLIVFMTSFFVKQLIPLRRRSLIIVLSAVIAGGLLVNAILKPYWGRPRPRQITEFGGQWTYHHILPPGTPGKGESFPCGHCTMGFIFLAAMSKQRKRSAIVWAAVCTFLGIILSIARIAQGAHFPTDALWSLGIVLMTTTALNAFIKPASQPETSLDRKSTQPYKKALIIAGTVVGIIAIAAAFATRRPYYKTFSHYIDLQPGIDTIQIVLNRPVERLTTSYTNYQSAQLVVHTQGFGWLKHAYKLDVNRQIKDDTLVLDLKTEVQSYFSELNHTIEFFLPLTFKNRIHVYLNDDAKQSNPIQY